MTARSHPERCGAAMNWRDDRRAAVMALYAKGLSAAEIAQELGLTRAVAGAVLGKAGVRKPEPAKCACGAALGWSNRTGNCRGCSSRRSLERPVPADFAEIASSNMRNAEVAKHYGAGLRTVARWRLQTGIVGKPGGRADLRKAPVPAKFATLAPTMTRNQLRLHFSCGFTAIDRWLREVGVKAKFAPSQRVVTGASSRTFNPLNQPRRDTTRAGLAADYLRRFGPVVRCDASGAYDPEGDHWRRGITVLSAEEIEQRALRNGWKPDAWQALSGPLEVSSNFVAISHAPGA